ncbi:hypothetical protein TPA0598_08_04010 [Streptomyces lydicamycinicus]|uniref:Uncharacterized protein n=1 Tax=Streptomyces lydicamycinicus TaxID=1546107 RepID=A0A0P4RF28_9ACTN|nr:hypothetical protein TPA0598_08_04010 [Streptomyces lydicamycinicus]
MELRGSSGPLGWRGLGRAGHGDDEQSGRREGGGAGDPPQWTVPVSEPHASPLNEIDIVVSYMAQG